jgi:hypothetical protein
MSDRHATNPDDDTPMEASILRVEGKSDKSKISNSERKRNDHKKKKKKHKRRSRDNSSSDDSSSSISSSSSDDTTRRPHKKHRKRKSKKKRRKNRDDDSSVDDVRRSVITGKKIKMHIEKTDEDRAQDAAREQLLEYMNSSYK